MEAKLITQIQITLTAATLAVGVKGFMQARAMLAKGQDILANKTSMGGKIPVVYGVRRVGAQIIYMDVNEMILEICMLFMLYQLVSAMRLLEEQLSLMATH